MELLNLIKPLFKGIAIFLLLQSNAHSASIDQVKTAFLYHFSHYISWPESVFLSDQSEFTICLNANQELTNLMMLTVLDEKINNRPFKVIKLLNLKNTKACQILYISSAKYHDTSAKLLFKQISPTLLVSDKKGFAGQGGMIEMQQEGKHLKMLVNLKKVEQSGLKIRSTLLNLVTIVE